MTRTTFSTLSTYPQTAIAFIDRGVEDYRSLVTGTQEGIRVVLLDRHRNGIEQIAQALAEENRFRDIHIISHGAPGCLQLGNTQLNLETLDRNATQLKTAFSGASNLLLYGCNVAAGDAGEELLAKLHHLTGIEIAASARRTGNTTLGADWNLEVTTANFTGNLAFTSEAMAAYPFAFPIGVNDIRAVYKDLNDDTSGDYSSQEVNGGQIFDHKFQVGENNNLLLYGFTYTDPVTNQTIEFSLDSLVDDIKIRRVDHANASDPVSGERQVIWFEGEVDTSTTPNETINLNPSSANTMEDVLLSQIINRGTDNIFGNQGNPKGNNNNIERVDFVSPGGLSANGTALNEIGFLILERGGNDAFKIAAITDIDAQGNPTEFGDLISVSRDAWIGSSLERIPTEVMRRDDGEANLRSTDSVTPQDIAGMFVSYEDLLNGLPTPDTTTFYGYSLFANDIAPNSSSAALVDFNSFPTDTQQGGGTGGLDLIGGGGVFVINTAPELDLDNSNTSSTSYTNTFTPGGSAVTIADADVGISNAEINAPGTTSGKEVVSATITLTNILDGNLEDLSLNPAATTVASNANLTITAYNPTTGELTISGPADLSIYQQVIAGIVYDNTAGTPDTTDRTINVVVSDGVTNSNTAVSTISFDTSNTAPTASDNTIDTDRDTPYTFVPRDFGFSDDDGDTLQAVKITSLPTKGTLQLNGVDVADEDVISIADIQNGNFQFVPDDDENAPGSSAFNFQVSDGNAFSGDSTITFNIDSINDEPTFSGLDNNPTFTPEGSPIVLDDNATISDPELAEADNYNGATLALERDGGANGDDLFGASGTLGPLTEGANLVVGGTTIGTVTTNSGGTLELTFDGNATQALVNQALQQITYSNSSSTPPASARINYTFNDGNTGDVQGSGGAKNGTGSITVNIGSTTPGDGGTPPTTPPTTDPPATATSEPEITVSTAETSDIVDGTPTPQDLGSHPVGTPFTQTFTIDNTGTADLILDPSSLDLPDGFTLVGDFPETITPGSSATFTVELDPNTPGTYGGTISFTNNDADEGTFDFPVEVTITDNSPTPSVSTPSEPRVSQVSTPTQTEVETPVDAIVPPNIVPHNDDDTCCCPTPPTLDGVVIQPIPGFDYTLQQQPNIANLLIGSNNNDSQLGTIENDAIFGLAGDDRADGSDGDDLLVGGLSSPAPVGSTLDRDTLYGNRGNDVILGNEGNDRIEAGQDDDVVFAGKDNDRLEGEMGRDTLLGEQGNDTVFGGTNDPNFVDPGIDLIYGGAGNDELYGNQGNDSISGGDGNDVAYGGKDGDLLSGEAGNDTLKGERGDDTILGSLGRTNGVGASGDRDWLSGNEGNDLIKGGEGKDTIYAGQERDLVYGGKDDDLIYGDKGSDTLRGDIGNDTMFGGTNRSNDSESSNDGDVIFGNAGDDVIHGNLGNDNIVGGIGNDTVRGGQQDDLIWGEAGNDLLFGDLGNDSVCGGDGDDTLIGSNGNPLNTADGDDKLCGGAGDDRIFGNEGDDKLTGNSGDDRLYGGRGNDTITAGSGSDILSAEQGNDILTGNGGGDRFDFGANHGTNIITDFTDGEDLIGLKDGITFAQLSIAQVGNDTQITTGDLSVTLQGVNVSAIGSDDFALV